MMVLIVCVEVEEELEELDAFVSLVSVFDLCVGRTTLVVADEELVFVALELGCLRLLWFAAASKQPLNPTNNPTITNKNIEFLSLKTIILF